MKKAVVIYKSKYGSSEKYAKWIAEETNADIFKLKEIKINILENYDTICYCGGVYASTINGFSKIKKNFDKISNKKVIVVAVGTAPNNNSTKRSLKKSNFTDEIKDKINFFVVRGELNYDKMNFIYKFVMFIVMQSAKSKKNLSEEAKATIASYGKNIDFSNKDDIKPIVELIKSDS